MHVGALAHQQRTVRRRSSSTVSMPLTASALVVGARRAARLPRGHARPAPRMCGAVVPQQPPTRFSQPCVDEALAAPAPACRASRCSGRPRRAARRWARRPPACAPAADSERMWSVMNSGPVAQLSPIVEQVDVRQRDRERLGGLPGEHGAGRLDGARHHHRHAPAELARGARRWPSSAALTLRVSWQVSTQQVVDAALDEAERLLRKWLDQLVEGDAAGDRDGLGGRAPSSRPRSAVGPARRDVGRSLAGQRAPPRALSSRACCCQAVLGEHQRGAAEGVGLDDVGAGFEVAAVHPRTTSGRVRTRISLQPSRSAPPKSAAVRFTAWSAVPMAPSRTRMRSCNASCSAWMRRSRSAGGGPVISSTPTSAGARSPRR